MAEVRVAVTVVRKREETARIEMIVDENDDQWSIFEHAAQIADAKADTGDSPWIVGDVSLSRFHSGVRVLEEVSSVTA